MRVAITVWGNRISPVLDSAQTLLIAEIKESAIITRQIETCSTASIGDFIAQLSQLKVHALICGALTHEPATLLSTNGIEVIPFMTGKAELILDFYAKGGNLKEFIMPGCPHSGCCRINPGPGETRHIQRAVVSNPKDKP